MNAEPKLEPAGAGIPLRQRLLFGILMRTTVFLPRSLLTKRHRALVDEILSRAKNLSAEEMQRRELISPIPGLEDSSRYWSVAMTIDHLRIVEEGISDIILALHQRRDFDRVVRTQDVKPSPKATLSVIDDFQTLTAATTVKFDAIETLKRRGTHAHPWFGKLDAREWFALRTIHLRLHLKQIDAIIPQLRE